MVNLINPITLSLCMRMCLCVFKRKKWMGMCNSPPIKKVRVNEKIGRRVVAQIKYHQQ